MKACRREQPSDHRRFLDVVGNLLEETPEQPHAERQRDRAVGNHQREAGIAESQFHEQRKQRDGQQQRRKHVGVEHGADDQHLAPEPQPGDRIGDQDRDQDGDHHGSRGDQDRVHEPGREIGVRQQHAVIVECERPGDQARRGVERAIVAQARDDHPIDRKEGVEHGQADQSVEDDPALQAVLHPASPFRRAERSGSRRGCRPRG